MSDEPTAKAETTGPATESFRGVFKSYDVRGRYGTEITESLANLIGRAYTQVLRAKRIAVGRDMRVHSPALEDSLVAGITAAGADAVRIGQCSTPMTYFAAATLDVDGAIMVTASHNPSPDNGFKFSKRGGEPTGEGTGLEKVKELVMSGKAEAISGPPGNVSTHQLLDEWCRYLKRYAFPLRPLKIAIDCGNGVMGPILRQLLKEVDPSGKLQIVWLFDEPDGTFPWHPADPLKPVNLQHLQGAVLATKADFGVAFDGDGDRLAFVDEGARFIGCDLMTAVFASKLLSQPQNQGRIVMYDLRSSAVVREVIVAASGVPLTSRVGHSHIKAAMRGHLEGNVSDPTISGEIVFAGEVSGHFFFRDCFCIDSSERAFLLALQLLSEGSQTLGQLTAPLRKYWQSGELSYRLPSDEKKQQVLSEIESRFTGNHVSRLDGISVTTERFWFNVRFSNTEPVVRLTVESLAGLAELERLLGELETIIQKLGGAKQAR